MKNKTKILRFRLPHAFRSSICALMLMSLGAVSSCSDDTDYWANAEIPEDVNVMELDSWCTDVSLNIKSNTDWHVETEGDFIYVYPEKGTGNQTIKLCTMDNITDKRQPGKVSIVTKDGVQSIIEVEQKCKADYGDNADLFNSNPSKKMAVGYGYNSLTGFSSPNKNVTNAILRMSLIEEKGLRMFEDCEAKYIITQNCGSSAEQLASTIMAQGNLKGRCWGVAGELGMYFSKNELESTSHEFSITTIERGLGEMSIPKSYEDQDGKEGYFTELISPSMQDRLNGKIVSRVDYSGVEGAKRLIKDYGTHLIMKAPMGGSISSSLTVDASSIEGDYDLGAYTSISYSSLKIEGSVSIAGSMKSSYSSNSQSMRHEITSLGGDLILDKSADAAMVKKWEQSLKKNADDFNLAFYRLSDDQEALIPIEDLVWMEDKTKEQERKEDIRTAIEQLKSGMQISFTNSSEIKIEIPSFDQHSTTNTLMKQIFVGKQPKAMLCNEFIPQINAENRVDVIYPILNSKVKYNMGYFIGDETHKPHFVRWLKDGGLIIQEDTDSLAKVGRLNVIYTKNSSFSNIQKTKEVFEGAIQDYVVKFNKWEPGKTIDNIGTYPLVKIYDKIWLREDYKGLQYSNGQNIHGYGALHLGHLHDQSVDVQEYEGAIYYNRDAIQNTIGYTLPPNNKWKIPCREDFEHIKNFSIESGLSNIAAGLLFRTPQSGDRKTSYTGFEAPTRPQDGWFYWEGVWKFSGFGSENLYHTLESDGGVGYMTLKDGGIGYYPPQLLDNSFYLKPVRLYSPIY